MQLEKFKKYNYYVAMKKRARINPTKIKDLMIESNISNAELSRRLGTDRSTITNILSGQIMSSKYTNEIAKILKTTPDYLTDLTDDPNIGNLPSAEEILKGLDLVEIKEGNEAFEIINVRPYPREFIADYGSNFEDLLQIRGFSDAIINISDSDFIFIDTSKITPRDGKIYALKINEQSQLRRINAAPDGFTLLADNPVYAPCFVKIEDIKIIGEVVGIFRKV